MQALFINHFEYTRNLTFAKEYVYPLLDGLNAWWGCFLTKVKDPSAPGGYVYTDNSIVDPDEQHGQCSVGHACSFRSSDRTCSSSGAVPFGAILAVVAHS